MSPYNPEIPFDVLPELFDEPQEASTPEHYALLALDMFARENGRRGFAIKLSNDIGDLIQKGYPDDSDEVLKLKMQQHTTLMRADSYGRASKIVFAHGYGIDTITITKNIDLNMPGHHSVKAKDPAFSRMLDSTFNDLYNNYGGFLNAKLRDTVRDKKIPVRLSGYSPIDLHIDKQLHQDNSEKPTLIPSNLEEPQENKTYLIQSKERLIDALSVFGIRRGRLYYLSSFEDTQKNSPAFDRDTHHLTVLPMLEGQNLKTFCDHLSPDQMVQFAKLLHAEATELYLLYTAENDPEALTATGDAIDDLVKASWKEFWNVYNGWDEDTNNFRLDYQEELRTDIKNINKAEKARINILKKRHYRLGQIVLH